MRIYMFPATSMPNPYITNLIQGIEINGSSIVNKDKISKTDRILSLVFSEKYKPDVYHFNWIENYAAKNTIKNKLLSHYFLRKIKKIHKKGKRVAWTVHNKEPHDLNSNDKKLFVYFMSRFIPQIDVFFIHSKETKDFLVEKYGVDEKKIVYVPHGAYDNGGTFNPLSASTCFNITFFGLINPYKNVPVLIKSFKKFEKGKNTKLRIFGKCSDEELTKEITEIIENDESILFDNRYIPEEELELIFKDTNVVVLPYDIKTMINSGAAVLAFSYGRPIIATEFGAIQDLKNTSFVFSYNYNNYEDHVIMLENNLNQVYSIWLKDKNSFNAIMKDAFNYSNDELSWSSICTKIINGYCMK